MVDKALFIGTGGAKGAMHQLGVITNNLANVNTTGFRGDFEMKKQVAVDDDQKTQSRVYSVADKSYYDFRPGPIVNTGRSLDVAVSGDGFFAVQGIDGKEAYTRAGSFKIQDNVLKTQAGQVIKGSNGLVEIPEQASKVSIGLDGTVTASIKAQALPVVLSRIKLTKPDVTQLHKGVDGLFYFDGEQTGKQDDTVRLTPESLEGSNVNPIETLTELIQLSRQFEIHTNLMKTVQENASAANRLLDVPT